MLEVEVKAEQNRVDMSVFQLRVELMIEAARRKRVHRDQVHELHQALLHESLVRAMK
jgi:hypothetical protein